MNDLPDNFEKPKDRHGASIAVIILLAALLTATLVIAFTEVSTANARLADFQKDRLLNNQTAYNVTDYSRQELEEKLESQRSRVYEAYALEAYFCQPHGGGQTLLWSDARTSYRGTLITTEITCAWESGQQSWIWSFDQFTKETKLTIKMGDA